MRRCCFFGVLIVVGSFFPRADGGDDKTLRKHIDAIAAALQKGDRDRASQQAVAAARDIDDLHGLMFLFRGPRVPIGRSIPPLERTPIEQTLVQFARWAPTEAALKKDAELFEQLAYRTAAIALVAHDKPTDQAAAPGPRQDWN